MWLSHVCLLTGAYQSQTPYPPKDCRTEPDPPRLYFKGMTPKSLRKTFLNQGQSIPEGHSMNFIIVSFLTNDWINRRSEAYWTSSKFFGLSWTFSRILRGLESSQEHGLELFLETISSICASLLVCRVDKIICADSSQALQVYRSNVKPSQEVGPEHPTQVWSRRELSKSEGCPYDSYVLQATSLVPEEMQVNNYLARHSMPALYLPPWHIVTGSNTKDHEGLKDSKDLEKTWKLRAEALPGCLHQEWLGSSKLP